LLEGVGGREGGGGGRFEGEEAEKEKMWVETKKTRFFSSLFFSRLSLFLEGNDTARLTFPVPLAAAFVSDSRLSNTDFEGTRAGTERETRERETRERKRKLFLFSQTKWKRLRKQGKLVARVRVFSFFF
jgi:hypothetical protein